MDVALDLNFTEQVTVGSRRSRRGRREGRAGRHPHSRSDRVDRLHRDRAGDRAAGAVVQLSPSDDYRRHRHRAAGHASRPRADQVLVLVNGKRRHQSALVHLNSSIGRGSTGVDLECDPAVGHRSHRNPARRRRGSVRVGRHRGRHQHRAQRRSHAARGDLERRVCRRAPLSATAARRTARAACPAATSTSPTAGCSTWAGRGACRRQRQRDDRVGVPAATTARTAPRSTRATRSWSATRATTRSRSRTIAGAIPIRATS